MSLLWSRNISSLLVAGLDLRFQWLPGLTGAGPMISAMSSSLRGITNQEYFDLIAYCNYIYIHIFIYYIYMSDCENPRFTERTSTNLGRSHRLPHVCTIMIYGKLGGYRLQETAAFIYIYICVCVCVMNYE